MKCFIFIGLNNTTVFDKVNIRLTGVQTMELWRICTCHCDSRGRLGGRGLSKPAILKSISKSISSFAQYTRMVHKYKCNTWTTTLYTWYGHINYQRNTWLILIDWSIFIDAIHWKDLTIFHTYANKLVVYVTHIDASGWFLFVIFVPKFHQEQDEHILNEVRYTWTYVRFVILIAFP